MWRGSLLRWLVLAPTACSLVASQTDSEVHGQLIEALVEDEATPEFEVPERPRDGGWTIDRRLNDWTDIAVIEP
jgi:hypothetical protein